MDVVVVGLGAMGSAVTHYLARRGVRVTGIDRGSPPHSDGSSHGESRIIREAYFEHPLYVPLVRRAGELWRELEAQCGRSLLRRTGALMIGAGDGELVTGAALSARIHGIPHERLTAADLRRRFPALRVPESFEALLEPGAGVLDPEACIEAHLGRARDFGASLLTGRTARGWRGGREGIEVELEDRVLRADALVLCVGAWLPELLPELPLEVERQVMVWFELRSEGPGTYPGDGPSFLVEAGEQELFYGIPDPTGEIKVARHHGGEVGARAALDPAVRPADVADVTRFLDRYLPGAVGERRRGVVCRYTNTPTERFLIARLPGNDRVHIVSACSGHGFKFASGIGEAVAARVLDDPERLDLSPFGFDAALARSTPTPGSAA